jgi:hypothetical protein
MLQKNRAAATLRISLTLLEKLAKCVIWASPSPLPLCYQLLVEAIMYLLYTESRKTAIVERGGRCRCSSLRVRWDRTQIRRQQQSLGLIQIFPLLSRVYKNVSV